jgi:hypothetical protein
MSTPSRFSSPFKGPYADHQPLNLQTSAFYSHPRVIINSLDSFTFHDNLILCCFSAAIYLEPPPRPANLHSNYLGRSTSTSPSPATCVTQSTHGRTLNESVEGSHLLNSCSDPTSRSKNPRRRVAEEIGDHSVVPLYDLTEIQDGVAGRLFGFSDGWRRCGISVQRLWRRMFTKTDSHCTAH